MVRTGIGRGYASVVLAFGAVFATAQAAALSHWPDAAFHDSFEGLASGPSTDGDASRFLTQATFGPTAADIAHLRAVGYQGWLNEQFAAVASTEVPYLDWVEHLTCVPVNSGCNNVYDEQRLESWWINALGAPDPSTGHPLHTDQLRQRVAFALSEIFVVSYRNGQLTYQPWALASFYDMLARDAFGNYRTLLEDVTKHPAMGVYLSMIDNQKADPAHNIHPDENYAREVNQLFSVGLVQLKLDGTPKLVNGQPAPTYDQAAVRGFAAVFTGWDWGGAGCDAQTYFYCGPSNPDEAPWRQSMQPVETWHDNTSDKQLLTYPGVALANGVLVHGADAQMELTAALDNIFHHPNVGPFIATRLIQRLVTSNPTPAYVQRVAQVFNDDASAQHVRGNLKAVVTAIVLDAEARYGQWQHPDTFGKLREPVLKIAHLWRAMAARSSNGRLSYIGDYGSFDAIYGQAPLRSPTVFNFFKPNFQYPGEIRNLGLVSPEFQIATDTQVVAAPNDIGWHISYFYTGSTYDNATAPDAILIDENRDATLAFNSPAQLVDNYNYLFMSGQMSPFMRNTLVTRLAALTDNSGGDLGRQRVQHALYLIMNSPEYSVQK